MASLVTNKGAYHMCNITFQNGTEPTVYYIRLFTSATAPTVDVNVVGDMTSLGAGYGYTLNGISITRDATGFPDCTEDDTNDLCSVKLKDVTLTASGGNIGAFRYIGLTDDNGTDASRIVICVWDYGADKTILDGESLTLQDLEIQLHTT